jgi:uncharacterized protein YjhX (UPF0386 family)
MSHEETKILNTLAQPVHITLTRNSKGYTWEVSVHAESVGFALQRVEDAEQELKAKYGNGT